MAKLLLTYESQSPHAGDEPRTANIDANTETTHFFDTLFIFPFLVYHCDYCL